MLTTDWQEFIFIESSAKDCRHAQTWKHTGIPQRYPLLSLCIALQEALGDDENRFSFVTDPISSIYSSSSRIYVRNHSLISNLWFDKREVSIYLYAGYSNVPAG
jgi:hypothetical protein